MEEARDDAAPIGAPRILAGFLALVGLVLTAGGAKLLTLGGTPYYLLAGIATGGAGLLLWRGSRLGSRLYGAMLAATFLWAFWEAGLDGWVLAPRLVGPSLIGLWLLTPAVQRRLAGEGLFSRRGAARAALAGVSVALVVGAAAVAPRPVAQAAAGAPAARVAAVPEQASGADWLHYGGDIGASRFSTLDQIRPDNVSRLKVAWTFHTDPMPKGPKGTLEVTPLKIGDRLYACNGANVVYALDPDTGKLIWRYDPRSNPKGVIAGTCRGVAYFEAPGPAAACAKRLFTTTIDARLIALDAATGKPCPGFGQDGVVQLKSGLGPHKPGLYQLTSAPMVLRGKVIIGGRISDNYEMGEPSGVVRAYDAVTGRFAWAWDVGRPGVLTEPGPGERYTPGTPNVWAPTSADEALGLVYLPTGNATPDYWGGERTAEMDRYSSSVVAIEAETGAVRWSFQTAHHDLWDYDVASQPTLIDFPTPAGPVPALIQATKRGEVFVLDRRDGRPIARVEERSVPQGAAPGDHLAATQPFSVGMPAFAGEPIRERDLWGLTPIDQMWCRIRFRGARYDGPMTPPGLKPTIAYPGYLGGMGWGGVSIDLDRKLMVVNWNRVANHVRLIPRKEVEAMGLSPKERAKRHIALQTGTPFAVETAPFLSPLGVPCQEPPFGLLSVVDLKTRTTLWTRPLGSARDSGPFNTASQLPIAMGVPNEGGSLVTRPGLVFIGASREQALFAFDIRTGRLVWKDRLPAGGQANPMTFRSARTGRQYLVIAAGGHPVMMTRAGDEIIAYALPDALAGS